MQPLEIYTAPFRDHCRMATHLLGRKGVAATGFDISADPGLRAAMTERAAGLRGVPQIFLAERHPGTCDELYALERAGKLDALLDR